MKIVVYMNPRIKKKFGCDSSNQIKANTYTFAYQLLKFTFLCTHQNNKELLWKLMHISKANNRLREKKPFVLRWKHIKEYSAGNQIYKLYEEAKISNVVASFQVSFFDFFFWTISTECGWIKFKRISSLLFFFLPQNNNEYVTMEKDKEEEKKNNE